MTPDAASGTVWTVFVPEALTGDCWLVTSGLGFTENIKRATAANSISAEITHMMIALCDDFFTGVGSGCADPPSDTGLDSR